MHNTNLISELVIAITAFSIGFVTGYLAASIINKYKPDLDEKKTITLAVTFVWVVSIIITWVNPNFHVPVEVHTIMGGVVGFLGILQRKNEKS